MASSLNFKSILVFGDSHLAGKDLDENENSIIEKQKTWPNIVGRHFNIPIKNFAQNGGSNERSLRILAEILLNNPNSLVIYGITEWTRHEFVKKNIQYINLGLCNKGRFNNSVDENINDWYINEFLKYKINEIKQNNYYILNHLFFVQTLCEKYAANFVILPCMQFSLNLNKIEKQNVLFNSINQNKIFKFTENNLKFDTWVDWCRYKNFPRGKYNHFTQTAHDEFAQIFIEYLISNMT